MFPQIPCALARTALALCLVIGCTSPRASTHDPNSVTVPLIPVQASAPPSHEAEGEPKNARAYAIGRWHLGEPLEAFASARPDLWQTHKVEYQGDWRAVRIGAHHPSANDPARGAHLAFFAWPGGPIESAEAFAPTLLIALGETASGLFQPPLPTLMAARTSLGHLSWAVEWPMVDEDLTMLEEGLADPTLNEASKEQIRRELATRPRSPKTLRLEAFRSRVAVVSGDSEALGFVLGQVPTDPNHELYKDLGQLVAVHLGLR